MATISKTFSTAASGAKLNVVAKSGNISLQKTSTGGSSTAAAAATSDPKGLKNYIAFDVAHGIYPQGSSVDPNQPISSDMSSNSDARAIQINLYAHQDALKFGYTWTPVSASGVSGLQTVGSLMDLVVANLS